VKNTVFNFVVKNYLIITTVYMAENLINDINNRDFCSVNAVLKVPVYV